MPAQTHPDLRTVTLADVDQAVKDWFDRTVDAHVEDSQGPRKKVPVIFSTGERAITSRSRRALRDKNGVLILPVISVRRTGVSPDLSNQALGTETESLQFHRRLDGKTSDLLNLNRLREPSNRVPDPVVYEVWSIPFPDRSVLNYEVLIWTQYVTQMNDVYQKVVRELDIQKSFVAVLDRPQRHSKDGLPFEYRPPLKSHYVVGFLDADLTEGGNFEEFTDQERIVQWTTSVRVPATLVLQPEGERSVAQVTRTASGIVLGKESVHLVDDPEEIELIFRDGRVREV